jgi:hypothetical protein
VRIEQQSEIRSGGARAMLCALAGERGRAATLHDRFNTGGGQRGTRHHFGERASTDIAAAYEQQAR